jgi:hypothetical protein
MIRRIVRVATALLLALLLIAPPRLALACGPDFSLPIYINYSEPDDNAAFARGKLGLIQRGYWHSYLFEAYRNLSGQLFTKEELAALNFDTGSPAAATPSPERSTNWIETWETTRANYLAEKPGPSPFGSDPVGIIRQVMHDDQFVEYYNCLSGAFENAVHTLQSRVSQFGPQSPAVKEWIAAQDQVFDNCSAGQGYPAPSKAAVIPAAARAEDPAVIRADRAYQIAAALFYAGDLDAAQKAFEDIAKDSSSPYQKIAPYLRARALIRKAALSGDGATYDDKYLAQAESQLNAIVAEKNLAEYHPAAQRLLGFVRIRLHRQERLRELESVLTTPGVPKSFNQDLADYLWLLDHPVLTKLVTIAPDADGKPEQRGVTVDESSRLQGGDLTDWILTFQQTGEEAYQHALQKWQQTKSLPWLVSAVAHASSSDAALSELVAAASKVAPDSPAYLTLAFHRLRLLEQSGLRDVARRGVDALLAEQSASMPISTRNELRALRMELASNLHELLQFAPRISTDATSIAQSSPADATKSAFAPGSPEWAATRPHFDSDASVVFTEKLPLRLLADAAKSNVLPAALRADVAVAAWTRAIELKNDSVAGEMTPILSELVPGLKGDLAEYSAANQRPVNLQRFSSCCAIRGSGRL